MMKKSLRSISGVTLLEIMLVLAIAAMVIVMSVRYYQSATASQQANGALQTIQGIAAAADGLAQGTGSYSEGSVSSSTVAELMPNGKLRAPWGGAITFGTVGDSTYSVTFANTPGPVCAQLKSRLAGNSKYSVTAPTSCGSTASFTYTYDNSK